jgi:hypothetical protein
VDVAGDGGVAVVGVDVGVAVGVEVGVETGGGVDVVEDPDPDPDPLLWPLALPPPVAVAATRANFLTPAVAVSVVGAVAVLGDAVESAESWYLTCPGADAGFFPLAADAAQSRAATRHRIVAAMRKRAGAWRGRRPIHSASSAPTGR